MNRALKRIFIILGILVVVVIAIAIHYTNTHRKIEDEVLKDPSTKIIQYDEKKIISLIEKQEELSWYKDIDEAFNDNEYCDLSGMVLFAEFQNDYSCRRMYYDPSSKVTKTVIALDVVKSDEVYSQPIYYGEVIINIFEQSDYKYSCVDNIAEGMWINYFNIIPFYENHAVDCFGFWNNKDELKDVTIEGQNIKDFYELNYDDGTSYVMWKLSLDDVQDKLKAIEGDVTPSLIIKTLDIKTKNKD